MHLFTSILRTQLFILNKLADKCSIEKSRAFQNKLGRLMASEYRSEVIYRPINLPGFQAEYVISKNLKFNGIILYLHGGGYISGNMEYAEGFATILAAQNHISVCSVAYRLAPENMFPAALDDAFMAYCYLMENGYENKKIVLCGESAGGGLVYALALKLKAKQIPMPCGIIAISPWTDLSLSGTSYKYNKDKDPTMTKERLSFFAHKYTDNINSPFVSPLLGDLTDMPTSLIFVGGDEIMLSDSVDLHKKLCKAGSLSSLYVAPEMWHIYPFYRIKQAKKDREKISEFLREVLNDK